VGQPRKMGTGPGLLLPLARVLARSPRARVIVTPSDHHLQDPERFLAHVEPGLRAAEAAPAGVCLLGVPAARPAVDLGWIVPGAPLPATPGAALIERFVEKPAPEVATALFEAGALWNTFVLVGGASRLWSTAARQLREQARAFEPYFPAVDGPGEGAALSRVFDRIAPADFSRDVLARAEGLASLRVEGTGWTDWGTPERLLESLAGTPDLLDLKRRLARGPARPGLPASV
jgi:mannose-1-phosphate guanylyltransferase